MRVVIRRRASKTPFLHPVVWGLLGVCLLVAVAGASLFTFYYVRYSRLIDERLSGPVFPTV